MNFIKKLPNILTIIRFLLVPVIIGCLTTNHYLWAFVMYTISSITDVADGFIARKYNAISDFGKLMDPLADKLTQLSVLATLTLKGLIPIWIAAFFIIKETCLIAGASFLYGKKLVVSSKWYGKFTTVLLYLSIISSFLIRYFNLPQFDIYLYVLTVVFAVLSIIMYTRHFYVEGYLPNKKELNKISKND